MKARKTIAMGAALAGIAVSLGAFGAHKIKDMVEPDKLGVWLTGVRYLMWHGLALMLVGILQDKFKLSGVVPTLMTLGALLFSTSLFLLTFGILPSVMGPLTPLGGALMLASWFTLAVQVKRSARD